MTSLSEPTVEAPASIEEDAAWYEANAKRYWSCLYRLKAYVADNGPIKLASGKVVGMYSDGFAWNTEAVAEEFPALVASKDATIAGSPLDVDRALSLVLEEVPAINVTKIGYSLDKDAVNGTLRGGGAAGERLAELRVQKAKLGVR